MNLSVIAFHTFLEEHSGQYFNPAGIGFYLLDTSISVDYCKVYKPHNKYIELCLSYFSRNIQKFMRDFKIQNPKDIDRILQDHLWSLFLKGILEINCYMGEEFDATLLSFSYQNKKLVVKSDDDIQHLVHEPLKNVDDFLNYTLQHYQESID